MQYNPKISQNGKYLDFYGWSVISMLDNDLKFIENYISNHNILNKYFATLPSETYHMTLYNIWCNGKRLLNHQQRFIQQNFSKDNAITLENESKKYNNHFNPGGCINDLLFKLSFICNNHYYKKEKIKIKSIKYNGNTIRLSLTHSSKFDKINKIRDNCINVCEENDGMGSYHVTLAYKYKDIDTDTFKLIDDEIKILNILLKNQTITLSNPSVRYFTNMRNFVPFIQSI